MGVMGAGLAKSISDKWPIVKEEYLNLIASNKQDLPGLLGKCQIITIDSDLMVANLFGQFDYGRQSVKTKYNKLADCFHQLRNISIETKKDIYIPKFIGCGLAGGNWNTVFELIYKTFTQSVTQTYICSFP